MASPISTSNACRMLVFFSWLLVAFLWEVTAEEGEMIGPGPCEERVGGPLNLQPHEAGLLALYALIALGVVGLLCIALLAATCGYRVQANTLFRKLQDVERASKSSGTMVSSRPTTVVYSDLDADLPPPPPESPLPLPNDVNDNKRGMGEDDTKPHVPDSPTSEVLAAERKAGVENEGYSDDDDEVNDAIRKINAEADEDAVLAEDMDGSPEKPVEEDAGKGVQDTPVVQEESSEVPEKAVEDATEVPEEAPQKAVDVAQEEAPEVPEEATEVPEEVPEVQEVPKVQEAPTEAPSGQE